MTPDQPADERQGEDQNTTARFDFVAVANRLPVDRDDSDPNQPWRTSPGGLVTGLAPVMRSTHGAWVGWAGIADTDFAAFDIDGMHLVPVPLSSDEVIRYYEGFSNATLWPLYHDVIVPPEFHRTWWETYVQVNRRFAHAACQLAAPGATVWIHDYQLQLVPLLVRALRPDVSIGFFNHIPFPPYEIFAQLPWRNRILQGLLGADLIGFQRSADAANFRRAVRQSLGWVTKGALIHVPAEVPVAGPKRRTARTTAGMHSSSAAEASLGSQRDVTSGAEAPSDAEVAPAAKERSGQEAPTDAQPPASAHATLRAGAAHTSKAQAFPISIDTTYLEQLSQDEKIKQRAAQIREELGNPKVILLGVDRMDYTKGIRHRLKAFDELLSDGSLSVEDVTLVQIATPSRERLEQYQQIRTDVELAVGRINGEHATLGHTAVHYLHHSYPREEMTAFYLAADVMLVTALRDGMNLVAKEYVACRGETGALVLSEFAGAAEQLTGAIRVNPHDIDGMKEGILQAITMPADRQRKTMHSMRRKLRHDTVKFWSQSFLDTLDSLDTDKQDHV